MDGFSHFHLTVKATLMFLQLSAMFKLRFCCYELAFNSHADLDQLRRFSPARGGHLSHASASKLAAVPAVLRNLSYSTHSWRSPHMTRRYWEP